MLPDDMLATLSPITVHEQGYPPSTDSSGSPYIPQEVKNAQCEQALFILNYLEERSKRESLQASGVISFRLGDFAETYGAINAGSEVFVSTQAMGFLKKFTDRSIELRRG